MYVRAYVLPSALAWGFEWGIYSRNVRTYVSVTLRNVNLRSRARRWTHASRAPTQEDISIPDVLRHVVVFPHMQLQSINDTTNLTMEMCKIAISYNLSKAVDNNNNIRDNLRDLANQALDYLVSQAILPTIVSIVMLCLPEYIALTVHSYQLIPLLSVLSCCACLSISH